LIDQREPFLHVVACGSGIADGVGELIAAAHAVRVLDAIRADKAPSIRTHDGRHLL
jgi:hypothetical protein